MRSLILMLAVALCVPAVADEPKPLTPAEFEAFQADAGKPKETYTQAVQRFEASLESVNETLGNNTAELEAVKEELRAVKSSVDSLQKLLTVDSELSVPVPPVRVDAPKVDAPPVESGGNRLSGPTLNGKPLDVSATIAASYVRMWSFPGSIDDHLKEHGVAGAGGLDYETKRKLHSALHEIGNAPAKSVVKERTVVRQPVAVPQNCPNGQCPTGRPMQYGYQQTRQRLFGRWR